MAGLPFLLLRGRPWSAGRVLGAVRGARRSPALQASAARVSLGARDPPGRAGLGEGRALPEDWAAPAATPASRASRATSPAACSPQGPRGRAAPAAPRPPGALGRRAAFARPGMPAWLPRDAFGPCGGARPASPSRVCRVPLSPPLGRMEAVGAAAPAALAPRAVLRSARGGCSEVRTAGGRVGAEAFGPQAEGEKGRLHTRQGSAAIGSALQGETVCVRVTGGCDGDGPVWTLVQRSKRIFFFFFFSP